MAQAASPRFRELRDGAEQVAVGQVQNLCWRREVVALLLAWASLLFLCHAASVILDARLDDFFPLLSRD